MQEKIERFLKYISEIGLFLTELKFITLEENQRKNVKKETVNDNHDGFSNFLERLRAKNEALKLNNVDKNNAPNPEKEIDTDMIINMPGVSINRKPRKDGRYQGYVNTETGRLYVYGKSIDEVCAKIKFNLTCERKRKKPSFGNYPNTFHSFTMYYFETFRKRKVAERTFYNDRLRYEKYIKPFFNETPLKKITPGDCQELLDSIERQGKGKTLDEIYSMLSLIFKTAIKHGLISMNPIEIVFHVKHEKKHGSALTKVEEETLIKALEGSRWLPGYMLMLYTGLRPNELKTAKIDGPFIVAINSKRKNRKIEYKRIPISKKLQPYLKHEIKFTTLNLMRERFRKILPGHKLYDLRTTFYSRCKECGLSEHAIKYFMGHSLGEIANAYTDLSDDFLIAEMQKFDY